MSYCSRSRRRRFTVLDFKSWAYSLIYGHFQQHLYWACAETLSMNFRCKFRHRRSIRRPRFPVRVQNFGDLGTFSVDFCILYAECPPYFYFRFVWPTDLESIPHASTQTSIISTTFEAPTPIRSWIMSDNVSHWLPLKMRTRHCACAELRVKTITFLESATPVCLTLYNFGGSTMNIMKVIRENNARPCVKKRMSFCACAKSRDLFKVA